MKKSGLATFLIMCWLVIGPNTATGQEAGNASQPHLFFAVPDRPGASLQEAMTLIQSLPPKKLTVSRHERGMSRAVHFSFDLETGLITETRVDRGQSQTLSVAVDAPEAYVLELKKIGRLLRKAAFNAKKNGSAKKTSLKEISKEFENIYVLAKRLRASAPE